MDDLTTTVGIVAVAAGALGLLALVACALLWRRIGRLRAQQQAVLGPHGTDDVVAHATRLDAELRALQAHVDDVTEGVHARIGASEERLDGMIAYRGVVHYDAYGDMSGRQSTSLALLDARRSGVVVSSIHHRDQARVYAKQVVDGHGVLALSPEEEEAIRAALAGEVADAAEPRRR